MLIEVSKEYFSHIFFFKLIIYYDHPRNQIPPLDSPGPKSLPIVNRPKRDDALPLPLRRKAQHESLPKNEYRLLLRWKLQNKLPRCNRLHHAHGQVL